ncbi:hypothetical protein HPG69_018936 [Diceros bicornis minor]|uniref:G-protein coupled receptors family 1 profile domain-containing protein n=1 Tax=Diceros bicornis minor TaxID=77932 RepID=A0A7J7F9U4_DICBM|nr:hypothetical protein HPG69_018936 [Diceros bicornis minor]
MQALIFIFLFVTYTLSVTGNLTIITLTLAVSHLKTAVNLVYHGLHSQILIQLIKRGQDYFLHCLFCSTIFCHLPWSYRIFFLAVMPYDRCVAICKPLYYAIIMNSRVCGWLVICCWVVGFLVIFLPLCLGLNLNSVTIMSLIIFFFCDAFPMLKISCSDTWFIEQMTVALAILTTIMTLPCVLMSYIYIIKTIIKFPSVQQRRKAFSTCSSHVIVVSITYGGCIFIYIKPAAKDEVAINKCVSMLTTSVAHMLNPFIYTLRNKQVKQAFTDLIKRISMKVFFLLAIMSYGRYVAICKPLHYVTSMSSRVCRSSFLHIYIKTILKFPSTQQRKKSLSNCSSHVIVVFIAYESCIFNYNKPSSKGVDLNKGVSVFTASIAVVL